MTMAKPMAFPLKKMFQGDKERVKFFFLSSLIPHETPYFLTLPIDNNIRVENVL